MKASYKSDKHVGGKSDSQTSIVQDNWKFRSASVQLSKLSTKYYHGQPLLRKKIQCGIYSDESLKDFSFH